jgi:branched-chain amino acid transport system substrate-binding protein
LASPSPAAGTTPDTTETSPDVTVTEGSTLSGEIPVGFVFSLTGPAAIYGTSQQNAVQLAVEEINKSGMLGDATIRATIEDDESKPETGTTVFEKLINEDQAVAIIGPTLSNVALSTDPIAQEAGVPVIAVSNTAAGITEMGDYIFRVSLLESAVIPTTIEVTKEQLGYERVAIMYANDDAFSKSGYDAFKQALQSNRVEILAEETFSTNDTDFSAQLTKIKNLDPAPQALIVSALAQPAAGILTQMEQLGLDLPVIGGNGFNSPDLYRLAGDAANGVIAGAAWIVTNDNPKNQAFVEAYNEKYGKNPDQFAAQAYTGVNLLAEAIKNAGSTDRTAIRDALNQLKSVSTVLGTFSFENREPRHTPIVQQLEDGKFKLFQ